MIEDGVNWLMDQLATNASQSITYVREYDSVDVQATIGRTKLKTTDGSGGVKVEWTDKDFIVKASVLVFGTEPITPTRGDLIFWQRGDSVRVYEVRPYAYEPPYRDDEYEISYRIHAKLIRTDDAY